VLKLQFCSPHWVGKAPWLSQERQPKRALAVARKRVNVLTVNSDAPEYGKGGLE